VENSKMSDLAFPQINSTGKKEEMGLLQVKRVLRDPNKMQCVKLMYIPILTVKIILR
jgi:hypothetical protein